MGKREVITANIERLDGIIATLTRADTADASLAAMEFADLRATLVDVARAMGFYSPHHPMQGQELLDAQAQVAPGWVEGTDGPIPDWEQEGAKP